MERAAVARLCLSFAGASESIQWGDDHVYKVAGKMFACTGADPDSNFSFKVDEARFLELTDQPGVSPAPYLARAHWIQVDPGSCRLSRHELEALLRRSYELVVARLPKKTRAAILAGSRGERT